MIKGSVQEENMEAPQYMRQTLTDTKGEIDSNTIIVGHPTHTNGQIMKTEN